MSRRLWLVMYDIGSPKRLRQALHLIRQHRISGQYSVHECWLSDQELSHLQNKLQAIVDSRSDRCLLLPVMHSSMQNTLTY
jgi:CRISPR-associated endonuclease Cas2